MKGGDLMTERSNSSLTPWEIVRARYFNGETPDTASFAEKYGLDEREVRVVFNGEQTYFPDSLCGAFANDRGMTPHIFANISDQFLRKM
jgi:hypothetical protein